MSLSPDATAPGELARYQQRFAAYVRSPGDARVPPGLAPDRMRIYRELMLNNVSGFLHSCFPVLRQRLGGRSWGTLVRRFFAQHRSSTPYFREIPAEFVGWLFSDTRARLRDEPGFVPYLAHYEWLELAVDTHPDDPAPCRVQPWAPDLAAEPALNPSLRLACYPYAVQSIGIDRSVDVPMQTTWLMVWRNAHDRVCFGEINAASFEVLRQLQASRWSLQQLAEQMTASGAAPGMTLEQTLQHIAPLLAHLAEIGVVIGARSGG